MCKENSWGVHNHIWAGTHPGRARFGISKESPVIGLVKILINAFNPFWMKP